MSKIIVTLLALGAALVLAVGAFAFTQGGWGSYGPGWMNRLAGWCFTDAGPRGCPRYESGWEMQRRGGGPGWGSGRGRDGTRRNNRP